MTPQRPVQDISPGKQVIRFGIVYTISHIIDQETVLARISDSGNVKKLLIKDIQIDISEKQPMPWQYNKKKEDLNNISAADWHIAQKRLSHIIPLITLKWFPHDALQRAAAEAGVNETTIMSWVHKYKEHRDLSSLLPNEKKVGSKGKSRLKNETEKITKETITAYLLSVHDIADNF